jgi:hypothetical protein
VNHLRNLLIESGSSMPDRYAKEYIAMPDWLSMLLMIVAWIVLQTWLLPKMGVST